MPRRPEIQFPANPQDLTVPWLNQVLRSRGEFGGAQVTFFDTNLLGGTKGALGQVVRLSLHYHADPQRAPRTLIAKFAPANPDVRSGLHQAGFYEREVRFYQELAGDSTLRTPDCYFSAIDMESGDFVLLLEDLSAARNGDRLAGCSQREAAFALREIAKFHAAWWENPGLVEKKWLRSYFTPLALQVGAMFYHRRWESFVAATANDLPAQIYELGLQLGDNINSVFERFHRAPRTVVHNDYMLDNLFFDLPADVDSFAVIDWQFVTHGCAMLDVASLLGGNLSIEDRRAHEMDLLHTYHAALQESGVRAYPFSRCRNDYRFAMLDGLFRMVMAVGGDLDGDEEQVRVHKDIIWPRYCAALLDLGVAIDELG